MKKTFISLMSILIVVSLLSCSSKEKFDVLLIGGNNDCFTGDTENKIVLYNHSQKPNVAKQKTIKYDGGEYEVEYDETVESYLYKDDIDYYKGYKDGEYVRFGINRYTNNIDSVLLPTKSKDEKTPKLSKDECLTIAKEYIKQYLGTFEYELTKEQDNDVFSNYSFEFNRVIDGVKTSEGAFVDVTYWGNIKYHCFFSTGDLKNAKLPSEEEMNAMCSVAEEKIKSMYKNNQSEIFVSYEIKDKMLVRLANGKYAIKYDIDLLLKSTPDAEKPYSELAQLLVKIN